MELPERRDLYGSEVDFELLVSAAKASGLDSRIEFDDEGIFILGRLEWNPLASDMDALRLAVMCRITPHIDGNLTEAASTAGFFTEPHFDDPYAATRRAIVRAAAAMANPEITDQG